MCFPVIALGESNSGFLYDRGYAHQGMLLSSKVVYDPESCWGRCYVLRQHLNDGMTQLSRENTARSIVLALLVCLPSIVRLVRRHCRLGTPHGIVEMFWSSHPSWICTCLNPSVCPFLLNHLWNKVNYLFIYFLWWAIHSFSHMLFNVMADQCFCVWDVYLKVICLK